MRGLNFVEAALAFKIITKTDKKVQDFYDFEQVWDAAKAWIAAEELNIRLVYDRVNKLDCVIIATDKKDIIAMESGSLIEATIQAVVAAYRDRAKKEKGESSYLRPDLPRKRRKSNAR